MQIQDALFDGILSFQLEQAILSFEAESCLRHAKGQEAI